jgi:hypothetical protein
MLGHPIVLKTKHLFPGLGFSASTRKSGDRFFAKGRCASNQKHRREKWMIFFAKSDAVSICRSLAAECTLDHDEFGSHRFKRFRARLPRKTGATFSHPALPVQAPIQGAISR